MNRFVAVGLAAAAVVIVAFIGTQLIGGTPAGGAPSSPSGAPSATPAATPVPSSIPTLELVWSGPLDPGPYLITHVEPFSITITVPSGWESHAVPARVVGPDQSWVGYWTLVDLYSDPCEPTVQNLLGVGPTVDDLVQALRAYPGLHVAQTTDVTVSGFAGTRVALTGQNLDCPGNEFPAMAAQPGFDFNQNPGSIYARNQWIIVDVRGFRLVISAAVPMGSPPESFGEIESIIASTIIEVP